MSNQDEPVRVRALTVRVSGDECDRVEKHIERLRSKTPRLQISVTDAIRDLILRGLDDAERAR